MTINIGLLTYGLRPATRALDELNGFLLRHCNNFQHLTSSYDVKVTLIRRRTAIHAPRGAGDASAHVRSQQHGSFSNLFDFVGLLDGRFLGK